VFHIGDVIKKLRLQRNWTLEELASAAKVNKGTLSVQRGEGNPRGDTLQRTAKALGTTVEDMYAMLAGRATHRELDAEALDHDVSDYQREDIPVIQEGEASPNGLVWDAEAKSVRDVEEFTSRPYDFREKGAYAVILRGDSMEPLLKRGMRLVVSQSQPVGDGDLVYVQLRSGERMTKIATRQSGGWLLASANPAYPPRFVSTDEIAHIHRVAWVRFLK